MAACPYNRPSATCPVSRDVEGTRERLGGEEEEEWEWFGWHLASPVSPLVKDTGTSPAQAPRGPWH